MTSLDESAPTGVLTGTAVKTVTDYLFVKPAGFVVNGTTTLANSGSSSMSRMLGLASRPKERPPEENDKKEQPIVEDPRFMAMSIHDERALDRPDGERALWRSAQAVRKAGVEPTLVQGGAAPPGKNCGTIRNGYKSGPKVYRYRENDGTLGWIDRMRVRPLFKPSKDAKVEWNDDTFDESANMDHNHEAGLHTAAIAAGKAEARYRASAKAAAEARAKAKRAETAMRDRQALLAGFDGPTRITSREVYYGQDAWRRGDVDYYEHVETEEEKAAKVAAAEAAALWEATVERARVATEAAEQAKAAAEAAAAEARRASPDVAHSYTYAYTENYEYIYKGREEEEEYSYEYVYQDDESSAEYEYTYEDGSEGAGAGANSDPRVPAGAFNVGTTATPAGKLPTVPVGAPEVGSSSSTVVQQPAVAVDAGAGAIAGGAGPPSPGAMARIEQRDQKRDVKAAKVGSITGAAAGATGSTVAAATAAAGAAVAVPPASKPASAGNSDEFYYDDYYYEGGYYSGYYYEYELKSGGSKASGGGGSKASRGSKKSAAGSAAGSKAGSGVGSTGPPARPGSSLSTGSRGATGETSTLLSERMQDAPAATDAPPTVIRTMR